MKKSGSDPGSRPLSCLFYYAIPLIVAKKDKEKQTKVCFGPSLTRALWAIIQARAPLICFTCYLYINLVFKHRMLVFKHRRVKGSILLNSMATALIH